MNRLKPEQVRSLWWTPRQVSIDNVGLYRREHEPTPWMRLLQSLPSGIAPHAVICERALFLDETSPRLRRLPVVWLRRHLLPTLTLTSTSAANQVDSLLALVLRPFEQLLVLLYHSAIVDRFQPLVETLATRHHMFDGWKRDGGHVPWAALGPITRACFWRICVAQLLQTTPQYWQKRYEDNARRYHLPPASVHWDSVAYKVRSFVSHLVSIPCYRLVSLGIPISTWPLNGGCTAHHHPSRPRPTTASGMRMARIAWRALGHCHIECSAPTSSRILSPF